MVTVLASSPWSWSVVMVSSECEVAQSPQPRGHAPALAPRAMSVSFSPYSTVDGFLPPWELAKAFAFHKVLEKIADEVGSPAHELVGDRPRRQHARTAARAASWRGCHGYA